MREAWFGKPFAITLMASALLAGCAPLKVVTGTLSEIMGGLNVKPPPEEFPDTG